MAAPPRCSLADALTLHRQGAKDEAERAYRVILADPKGRPEAAMLLGVLLSERGLHAEAAAQLEDAVRRCPKTAAPPYNLGNVYRRQGRLEEALAAYDLAIDRDPEHLSSHLNRGITLVELGRPADAEPAFATVARLDPTHVDVRLQLGQLHLDAGRAGDAARWCLEAVGLDPSCVQARLDAGLACHAAGRRDDAVVLFREATKLAPDLAEAWCNLGAALRDVGETEAARSALEQAIALDPNAMAAYRNLGGLLWEERSFRSAMDICDAALAIDPDDVPSLRLRAQILATSSELAMAEPLLRRAIEIAPDDPAAYVELADLRRRQGDVDDAAALYERAVTLDPAYLDGWLGALGLARRRRDNPLIERAIEVLKARGANDPAAALAVADTLRGGGDAAAAVEMIEPLLGRPDLTTKQRRAAQFRLGEALAADDRPDEAWAAYLAANALVETTYDHAAFVSDVEQILDLDAQAAPRESGPVSTRFRPVFIVGMPRSGTTLTEQILAAHPDVAAAGESQLVTRVLARLEDLTGLSDPYPACLPSLDDERLRRLEDFARESLLDVAAVGSGPRPTVITEKTTGHVLCLGFLTRLFPDARIVWCRRDPLDTCVSCFTHHFTGNHPYAYDLEDLGRYAVEHARLMSIWQERLPGVITAFDYETLVADQRAATERLLAWCDLPWHDDCLAFHAVDRVVNTASADQVRQPLYQSSVGRHHLYDAHLGPLRGALAGGAAVSSE